MCNKRSPIHGETSILRGWALIVALCLADASHAATAMIAYGKAGTGAIQPKYRIWNGTAWGAEASANSIGSVPQWLVLRGSPIENRFILATLDNDSDVEAQEWNGTSWSTLYVLTDNAGTNTRRVFDVAYEQLSGHALAVYRETGTTQIRYRTYDGTNVSAEMSYTMTSGNVRWLQLVPKPGTDEIMVIAISNDNAVHKAAIWNGSSFANQVDMTGIDEPDTRREHADGIFEGVSRQGLIAYNQDSNSPGYRTLSLGAWSASLSAPSVGGRTQWTRFAADFNSDEVIMTTLDQANDINVVVWNGSSWGTCLQIESNTGYSDRRAMDIAYEPQGNEALIAYEDTTNTLKYRTWDGLGWSVELPGPTGGSSPLWNPQTVTGVSGGEIFVTYCTEDAQVRTVVWNGSSFGTSLFLGTISGNKEHECFMSAVAGDNVAPKVTVWQEVKP